MFRKQILQFIMEIIKFTFNLDHCICDHIFLGVLVVLGLFKLFTMRIADFFLASVIIVKQDMQELKAHWDKSDVREQLTNTIRDIRNSSFLKTLSR
jgi:hypothetical protein